MVAPARLSRLSYFLETTPGAPPADWNASGQLIHHLADEIDVTGLRRTMIMDDRNVTRVRYRYPEVHGIPEITQAFSVYWHGTKVSTADTVQVAETDLSKLLTNALGGVWRGTATTAKTGGAHTTTAVELTSATGYGKGGWLGITDAAGAVHIREIASITGDVATLHRPLAVAPVDLSKVVPIMAVHFKESVMKDSLSSGRQMSMLIHKGDVGSGEVFELVGGKLQIGGVTLSRNELARFAFTYLGHLNKTPNAATEPTWTQAHTGSAGVPIGTDTECFLQDFGTSTESSMHVAELTIEHGIQIERVPTITEKTANMPGMSRYTVVPGATNPTVVKLKLDPFADADWDDFDADTFKQLTYTKVGTEGNVIGVHFPKLHLRPPSRDAIGNVSSNMLEMVALERAADATAVDADLWQSEMVYLIG